GVEEDALGERRLAGVDVRRDTDVADAFEGDASCHGIRPSAGGCLGRRSSQTAAKREAARGGAVARAWEKAPNRGKVREFRGLVGATDGPRGGRAQPVNQPSAPSGPEAWARVA